MWDLFLGEGSCFRRGVFRYVCGLPDPGGEGARRGTRVHGRTEDYLQGRGEPLNPDVLEDSMAMALAQHLPAPGTAEDLARRGVIIEGVIEFERAGIIYNGRKDLEWLKPGEDDYHGIKEAPRVVVTDYKTTSDFKYALTIEQLRVHVQPVIYAAHSFLRHPQVSELDLNWLYVLSRLSPPVRSRDLTVTREHIEREMVRIDAGSKIILEVREDGDTREEGRARIEWANTLPHDETLTACTKYGKEGCPFKSQCSAHGGGSLAQVRTAFRAALNRNKRTETGAPDMTADELRAKLAAQKAAKVAPVAEVVAEVKKEAPAATPAAPATPASPPKFTPPTGRLLSKPPTSPGHNSVVPPQEAVTPDREELTGTHTVAEIQAAAQEAKAPDQETKPKAAPKPRAKAASAVEVKKGFTLAVNTIPSRPFVSLATLLAPVHAAITEAHGVPHYMAINYTAKAVFAEVLSQYLDENPPANDVIIFVDARTGEGADALPVLERRAGDVYRGV